jgi:hypothetical protein
VGRVVERLERARLEKKIIDIQLKKGITNLKNFKNLEQMLREERTPSFKFENEKNNFKETFAKTLYKKIGKTFSPNPTRSDFMKTLQMKPKSKEINEIKALVDLDVSVGEGEKKKFILFSDDDPMQVTDDFCEKYHLSDEKKGDIQKRIEEGLSQNLTKKR